MLIERSPAAQRIVDGAMGLFAERGYAGTSVADIEQAAGLTPRASGTYRHSPSKKAVLEAGLAGAAPGHTGDKRTSLPGSGNCP